MSRDSTESPDLVSTDSPHSPSSDSPLYSPMPLYSPSMPEYLPGSPESAVEYVPTKKRRLHSDETKPKFPPPPVYRSPETSTTICPFFFSSWCEARGYFLLRRWQCSVYNEDCEDWEFFLLHVYYFHTVAQKEEI